MSQHSQRRLVTAALPYANGPKHIGHLAGAYLPADIYVRWLRNKGEEVAFICGSDEHGAAITIQALKEKTAPRQIIDTYHAMVKDCFEKLGISFDIYHRTSDPLHHETAKEFFLNLFHKGILTEETSEQYFDEEANIFLADRYITGTCPNCGNENAYGDQCEKCGSTLSPKELKNPRSALSGKIPVLRQTTHWMLPLQNYESFLKKWILEGHKEDWKINVYGQCKSWIESGLQARAVTRDLNWGVKVPLKEAEGKVLYVWFDAPIGYISATRQWAIEKGEDWEKWWKDKNTRLIHFIGKDNIVFHCIIFPVMLHAHGEYILPENVPANEFLNLEGNKMSTSRRWSVEMHEYLEAFPNRQDELRFVLTAIAPETKDSDFYWKYDGTPQSTDSFQAKINNELAAILGNLVNRVMVLTQKFFGGEVPTPASLTPIEHALLQELKDREKNIGEAIEKFRFREALAEMMNIARSGNKYFADTEPWKLIKTDPERTKTVIWASIQLTASLAYIMEPFLPFTSEKIFVQLGMKRSSYQFGFDLLQPGHKTGNPEILFAQVTDEEMDEQVKKLKDAAASNLPEKPAIKNAAMDITFDDFKKPDIRVGTILEGEAVPKSDKLLKFIVDVGFEKRQIVSGVAEHYKPEDLIGKQCLVLVNLPVKKIRGVESNGMLLFAEDTNGKLTLVAPASQAENGSVIS